VGNRGKSFPKVVDKGNEAEYDEKLFRNVFSTCRQRVGGVAEALFREVGQLLIADERGELFSD
jgi:hypothetical protein